MTVLPNRATVSSSDEDGVNMLGSSTEEILEPKVKRGLKKLEKGFKEIRLKDSLNEDGSRAKRKSKVFGKLAIEYAGESLFDEQDGDFGDIPILSPSPIPLSTPLVSKESKQSQFINADIPLHESFLKHSTKTLQFSSPALLLIIYLLHRL